MLDLDLDFFPIRTSKLTLSIDETFWVKITSAPPVCGMARVKGGAGGQVMWKDGS